MGFFRRSLDERFRGFGTAVMGVLNATPDSFYDGGAYAGERAAARVLALASAGAFVVDIGGESTRPAARAIPAREQLERIEPAVRCAVAEAQRRPGSIWVSVDTSDPAVAETVLDWGAHVINDVSCLANRDLARVVAKGNAALVLMHARGPMSNMLGFSQYPDDAYSDVVLETANEWNHARALALSAGVEREDVLFDPGLGFAKNARQSMALLRRLSEFATLGAPIVVGPSRKSFLELVEPCPPEQRLGATIAASLHAAFNGASLVRVHDVRVVSQAIRAQRLLSGIEHASTDRGNPVEAERQEQCSTAS